MNIIMLRWFYVELKFIFYRIKKEINNYLKLDFLGYLKNLLINKNKKWIFIFIRIVFFLYIFRLIFDILKIIFHFYYLIMYWFFNNLKFFLRFYIFDNFWLEFFSNIINFFQYFFLFIPFVRLNEKLKKKKKKLYIYIIERSIEHTIRIMWWRPKLRAKIAIPVDVLEFLIIFFGVVPTRLFIVLFIAPILDFTAFIYDHIIKWRLFFALFLHVHNYNKLAGIAYLRHGASLFHIALMLQKQGFEVPKFSFGERVKARFKYREYCKKYKNGELTPEILNDKTLDIYIYLFQLFTDTRYELKPLKLIEFFKIIFPYDFYHRLFYFSYYLYIGLIFLLCFIFFPIIIIYIAIGIAYEYYKWFEVIHFLLFLDLDYLAKEKDKIWTKIREDSTKVEEKKWYDKIYIIWKKIKEKLK